MTRLNGDWVCDISHMVATVPSRRRIDPATYAELGCAGSWRRSSAFTHFLSLAASCRNATFQRFVKFIVAPYRVVYRLREGTVEIATVFRGSREFPEFLR